MRIPTEDEKKMMYIENYADSQESTTLQSTLFKSNCNKEVNIIKTDIHISTSAVVGEATVGKAIIGTGEEE